MTAELVNKLKFETNNPQNYFKNFERLSALLKWDEEKSVNVAILHVGLVEEWLASEIEAKKFAKLKDVKDFVISRLQPPEKRSLALKQFHDARLQMNVSPREFSESLRLLLMKAMPEAQTETIQMMIKAQLLEAAPVGWKTKLYESPLDNLDQVISKMEVLRETETVVKRVSHNGGKLQQQRGVQCFNCHQYGHMAKQCKKKNNSARKCYNCSEVGHLANNCPKPKASRSVKFTRQAALNDDITVSVRLNSLPFCAVVDTGSPVMLLNENTASQLSLTHHVGCVDANLTSISGDKLRISGEVLVELEVDGVKCESMAYVMEGMKEAVILGRDILSKLRMKIDCEVPACVVGYVESKMGTGVKGVQHEIQLLEDEPVTSKPYRVPAHYEERVSVMLAELEERGVIQKSNSPYASPVVIVPKKDGDLRLCVDYRKLNSITVADPYPMPNLKEVVRVASSGTIFSTLDVKNGFWQVPMKEADIEKTAFTVNDTHFEFRFMPFGLVNAPKTFQRLMNDVVQDLNKEEGKRFISAYVDDLIIFSDSPEEHERHIKIALEKLDAKNVILNKSKCVWRKESVQYLGFSISHKEVKMKQNFVEEMDSWDTPKTVRELQRFLGFSGFYRDSIPNYATIAKYLTDLLRKDTPFTWGPKQKEAFENLKCAVKSAPAKITLDVTKPLVLVTDASGDGWGAVLEQDGRPVDFASGKWTKTEAAYSTTKRELRACLNAVNKFRYEIVGASDITWVTDHQALKSIKPQLLESTLFRWWNRINSLGMKIRCVKGEELPQADALSRKSVKLLHFDDEWKSAVEADENLQWAMNMVQSQKPMTHKPDEFEKRRYVQLRERLALRDGTLYFDDKAVVPQSLRTGIMKNAHLGHLGARRSSKQISLKYWWPGWQRQMTEFVSECVVCAKSKYKRRKHEEGIGKIDVYGEPFAQWAVDIKGPLPITGQGNRYILVCTDLFTKWVELYPIPDQQAKTIADKLIDLISRFSIPKEILSDQGANFQSQLLAELTSFFGIRKLRTTPYNPRCNGEVEKFNSTLGELLRCHLQERSKDWDEMLPLVADAYRKSEHSTTKFSPFQLVYGRHPVTQMNEHLENDLPTESYCSRLSDVMKRISQWHKEALENIQVAKRKTEKESAPGGYEVGDLVMLRKHNVLVGQTRKLSAYYDGPYEVVVVQRPDYVIMINGKERRVHGANLKLLKPRPHDGSLSEEDPPAGSYPEQSDDEGEPTTVVQIEPGEEAEERLQASSESEEEEDPLSFVTGRSKAGRLRRRTARFSP